MTKHDKGSLADLRRKTEEHKSFKPGKRQDVTSGQKLYDYEQPKRTANKPVKSGPEYQKAKRRAGGDIYS